jgi:hypothetical protein
MTKKAICTFALALGLTAMFATSSLSAQPGVNSETVYIPFAFHVDKVGMPAGEYRLERVFGKDTVNLINLQSGQRVFIVSHEATRPPGKAKLVFETGPQGYSLKKLS